MSHERKEVQRTATSSRGADGMASRNAASSVRSAVRDLDFASGEAALRPTHSEGAVPKGSLPSLIGAKGSEGKGTITPGGGAVGGGPQLGVKNADGLIEGGVGAADHPRIFANGGKEGVDTIYWSGGTGGRGQQYVASIDVVAPAIQTAESGGVGQAWVSPGTGSAKVTRSFRGVPAGDNGQYYITAAAAARVDVHEWLHVHSSQRHHDAIVAPLEARVAAATGQPAAVSAGATGAEAKTALEAKLDWNNTIVQWAWADYNDNQPMKAVDLADLAAPDFPRHLGPATVAGKAYIDYIAMPGETIPAPAGGATVGTPDGGGMDAGAGGRS